MQFMFNITVYFESFVGTGDQADKLFTSFEISKDVRFAMSNQYRECKQSFSVSH